MSPALAESLWLRAYAKTSADAALLAVRLAAADIHVRTQVKLDAIAYLTRDAINAAADKARYRLDIGRIRTKCREGLVDRIRRGCT